MVAGLLVICCRRTIPSTRAILPLGTSCVVSIPSSGSSPSCESGCIVENLLRRWINLDLSLHCSIVPSGEKKGSWCPSEFKVSNGLFLADVSARLGQDH